MIDNLAKDFIKYRDEYTFRILYRSLSPEIYPVCFRLLSFNKDLIEEAVQVFWTTLLEKIDSFHWKSSFKTWSIGIIINVSRKFYSKANKMYQLNEEALNIKDKRQKTK